MVSALPEKGLLLEQWAFAAPTELFADVAERGAGIAEDDAVSGLVVFLEGVQACMMAHLVTDLKIVVPGVVVLCGQSVLFALFVPNDDCVLGIKIDETIITIGALAAAFFLDGFVNHNAVPGSTRLPGKDSIEGYCEK